MRALIFDIHGQHLSTTTTTHCDFLHYNPLTHLDSKLLSSTNALVQAHRRQQKSLLAFLSNVKTILKNETIDLICCHQNPFPPEWLISECSKYIRVLGCFDDPQATYTRTLPAVVAYHGAYYCSPSYSSGELTKDIFHSFGIHHTHWFPLSYSSFCNQHEEAIRKSWKSRENVVVYVGKCYGDKVDRIAQINKNYGKQLRLHGQHWPLWGLGGFLAPLRGRRFLPRRVSPISKADRYSLYLKSRVGYNLHLGSNAETGNMRMYETTAHGLVLLCDKAGLNAHEMIYRPNVEALFYDDTNEAIELIDRCFKDTLWANSIAMSGYERCKCEYSHNLVLAKLASWAANLPNESKFSWPKNIMPHGHAH